MKGVIIILDLDLNLNIIYYENLNGDLGKFPTDLEGRISKKKASEYLKTKNIKFTQVFKVKKEKVNVKIPRSLVEKFVK